MTLLEFIILTLATWRISSLFVNEDGPFGMFARLRTAVGINYDEYSNAYATTFWGGLLNCLWCFSVWTGIALVIAHVFYPKLTILACLPLALSAGAIAVNKWTQ